MSQDVIQGTAAVDITANGHPNTESIMATWNRVKLFARGRFNLDQGAPYWCCAVLPSVANFDPSKPPEVSKQICFKVVDRGGIRVIEGDGVMVEAWS